MENAEKLKCGLEELEKTGACCSLVFGGNGGVPEVGGPAEANAVASGGIAGLGPAAQIDQQRCIVETDYRMFFGSAGKPPDEAVELGGEIAGRVNRAQVLTRKKTSEVAVVGVLALLSVAEFEGSFADGATDLMLRVFGVEGDEDGLAGVVERAELSEDGVGLTAGGGAPVAAKGGAVAAFGIAIAALGVAVERAAHVGDEDVLFGGLAHGDQTVTGCLAARLADFFGGCGCRAR